MGALISDIAMTMSRARLRDGVGKSCPKPPREVQNAAGAPEMSASKDKNYDKFQILFIMIGLCNLFMTIKNIELYVVKNEPLVHWIILTELRSRKYKIISHTIVSMYC